MDTEGRGEAGTSQSQSRHKKGDMTNFYLTYSDEEAIVDFVKDHEEPYNKTNEHFKYKARKECLRARFTTSNKLIWKTQPVQVLPGSQGNDREIELDSG